MPLVQDHPFGAATRLRFATVQEGQAAIATEDDWTVATSPFLRSATMALPPAIQVPLPRFLGYLKGTVKAWDEASQELWQPLLPALAQTFERFRIPLPPQVLLVRTDGRDWAHAPYTRGHAVFLPDGLRHDGYSRLEVLAHELVHIATRHHPAWASRLYQLLGFREVAPLQWPVEWLGVRLANPDATHAQHAIHLTLPDGRRVDAMPVLVARRPMLRPGETVLDLMEVRLVEVQVVPGQPTRPVRSKGLPVWHATTAVPDYLRQLGGNTSYIDHPEEVLADNIAFLVSGRPVRNPLLLALIEALMKPVAQP